MTQPLVISVILNTNRCEDTLECLTSLREGTYSNHKVIVLDNQSTDGSLDAIQKKFPSVEILELDKNLGFGGNNNVGINYALDLGADWIFVLNEDTILAEDCLTHLVTVGESDEHFGVLGPMMYHYEEPDLIQSAGGKLGTHWELFHLRKDEKGDDRFLEPYQVDWINGCGMLVRRTVIEQVGLIDERYFYYWDETEWCLRAKKNEA